MGRCPSLPTRGYGCKRLPAKICSFVVCQARPDLRAEPLTTPDAGPPGRRPRLLPHQGLPLYPAVAAQAPRPRGVRGAEEDHRVTVADVPPAPGRVADAEPTESQLHPGPIRPGRRLIGPPTDKPTAPPLCDNPIAGSNHAGPAAPGEGRRKIWCNPGCNRGLASSGGRGPRGPRPPTPPDVLTYPAVPLNRFTPRASGRG